MKKILSFIMAAALTATSFSALTASADNEKKDFVVFGDSISAGFTRAGNVEHNYGEILADYYGGTVANYSVSGANTDDLLNTVRGLSADQKKSLQDAECVVVSIGGNDILSYACKYLLDYFADPNPANGMKNFLKPGYTAADIPEKPDVQTLMDMVDSDSVVAFAGDVVNALELLTTIRTMSSKLRSTSDGYIKTHIMPNIADIAAEIKAVNPDAELIIENIYQPLQLDPAYVSKTYSNSSASTVVSQLRDIMEGIMKTFNEQLDSCAKTAGFKKADILNEFTSLDEGTTKSNSNPGHTAYFVDVQTGSLSTADFHPNQKGHLAIASKIIETIGDTHNDGGLLSDIYETLADKASYPAGAFKTYEAAAGTYAMGDANFDGIIDGRDATMVLTEYAKTSTGKGTFRYRQCCGRT